MQRCLHGFLRKSLGPANWWWRRWRRLEKEQWGSANRPSDPKTNSLVQPCEDSCGSDNPHRLHHSWWTRHSQWWGLDHFDLDHHGDVFHGGVLHCHDLHDDDDDVLYDSHDDDLHVLYDDDDLHHDDGDDLHDGDDDLRDLQHDDLHHDNLHGQSFHGHDDPCLSQFF